MSNPTVWVAYKGSKIVGVWVSEYPLPDNACPLDLDDCDHLCFQGADLTHLTLNSEWIYQNCEVLENMLVVIQ